MCNILEINIKHCTTDLVQKMRIFGRGLGFIDYYHGWDRLVFEQWSDNITRYSNLIDGLEKLCKENNMEWDDLLDLD